MKRYEIVGSEPSEVIKYLEEWLLAYDFSIESLGWLTKKDELKGKTVLGNTRVKEYEYAGTLEVLFDFEVSKISNGTSLIGGYYIMNPTDGSKKELTGVAIKWGSQDLWNPREPWPPIMYHDVIIYLLEFARGLVKELEDYFGLEEGKASEWHSEDVNFERISLERIKEVLTPELKHLREIARELGIQRIGDIRKLQKKLIDLSESKPDVIGGWYGFQMSGGYTGRTLILEGSFWRRDITR
jgi:hypothetical protein